MARVALKLVESQQFSVEELNLPLKQGDSKVHSLHSLCSLPGDINPEIAEYCIERFSTPGQLILDPFSGSGTVALQAALTGRDTIAADVNPIAIAYTLAKLKPADIAEVALTLQLQSLSKPIALTNFDKYFSAFYDVNTYREIVNLKDFISASPSRVVGFISAVASSLLHGHGAGSFSSYTYSSISLSPTEQQALNIERGQYPDYRSVQPRIFKKTASVMRDGYSTKLRSSKNAVFQTDARNLSRVANGSVDLVVTAPPYIRSKQDLDNLWLKLWFSDVSRAELESALSGPKNLEEWLEFINEVTFELARVVKPGGRVVFVFEELSKEYSQQDLNRHQQLLLDFIDESLSSYWSSELSIKCLPPTPVISGAGRTRSKKEMQEKNILVFRRR
ncbi:MAG: DNA adenine methylase [Bdellovibrionales bacterium]|nr:DNA adenine methylase [Bdellovibrionales bacterium]